MSFSQMGSLEGYGTLFGNMNKEEAVAVVAGIAKGDISNFSLILHS